jgi:hypothetical protein
LIDYECEFILVLRKGKFVILYPLLLMSGAENVLVHEWGHLRWGLFDEYPLEKNKRFYLEDGVWHPTR